MRGFWAIAAAQLGGRSVGLLAALAAGAALLLLPQVMPAWIGFGPDLVVLLWAVSQLVALFIGFSLFGEDLAAARLSFYFARPTGALAFWAARLATGTAQALAVQAALMLPTLLLWPDDHAFAYGAGRVIDTAPSFAQLALLTATLVAGGALAGILGRARSRWLIVDAVAAAAIVAATAWAVQAVIRLGQHVDHVVQSAHLRQDDRFNVFSERAGTLQWVAVVAALLAFVVATAAGIGRGRGGARRSHGAASLALWSIALPAVAACLVYVRWFLSPL